ncbi:hypothetical protein BGW38_010891 [Lunasporangiospora selenospora]|uniref:Autophagy-related protein n=1 Tax=Lunasporangiospora selenospora TaxID=979761 RepID=A0A9P6FXU9_9FUNG|nr:hypothetical protein BGW38_010891 [Lunasporangiospora selenospora]
MDERGTTNDLQALKEDTKCKNGDTDQVHLTATETDTIAAVGGATSGPVTLQQLRKTEEQVTNDLSAWCFGAANLGALVIQAACIGFSIGLASSPLRLQIAIAFTGVWWFVWTAVLMPWLDARPGPPMPKGRNWITYSWTKNWKTLKSIGQLSQISKFVLVWFILSDAVNTIISLLYVIAYQDLHFTHTKSVIMTLILSFTAFVGAYFFLWIRRIWALSTKFMFLLTVGLYIVSTAYFVIPTYFTVEFGLRQEWEAWAATVFVGFIVSTFYGAARVMLSELCPEGDENEWFSIFQLADKGSSWIGPLVTGVIQSVTGEFRIGFWFPLALFVFGGIVFITVDVDKGKDEAIRFKKEELAKHRLLASIPPITITPVPENSPPSSFPQDGRLTNI